MTYTLKEAAEELGITKNKLKYWISKAKLDIGVRDSETGIIRISEDELEQIRDIIFPSETDFNSFYEIDSDSDSTNDIVDASRAMQSYENRYQMLSQQFETLTAQLAIKDQQLAAASEQTEARLSEQAVLYEQRIAEKDQAKQELIGSFEQRMAAQKASYEDLLAEKDRRIEEYAQGIAKAADSYNAQLEALQAQIGDQAKRIESLAKQTERKSFWQRIFG